MSPVIHLTPMQWAEEMAAAERRGAERALLAAADEGPSRTATDGLWRMWLRKRAAALAHPSTDPDG